MSLAMIYYFNTFFRQNFGVGNQNIQLHNPNVLDVIHLCINFFYYSFIYMQGQLANNREKIFSERIVKYSIAL